MAKNCCLSNFYLTMHPLTVKTNLAGQVRQDHLKPLLSWEGDLLPWDIYTHALLYTPSSSYLVVGGFRIIGEEKAHMEMVHCKEEARLPTKMDDPTLFEHQMKF